MAHDYRTERKAFLERFKAWLETEEGARYKALIAKANRLEEPDHSRAVSDAWDIAEVAFERAHPEQKMRYSESA